MRSLTPYPIWIGHANDGREFRTILELGIEAIVQLAMEEAAIQPPRELISLRFPLLDGAGNNRNVLRLAIDGVANLIRRNVPTLVCCGAGMSRSPAIAAAAISVVTHSPVDETLRTIFQHHSVDISAALYLELRAVLSAPRNALVISDHETQSGSG